jgi:Spherulation-specific family 4
MTTHASGGRFRNIVGLSLILMLVIMFPMRASSAVVSAPSTGIMIPLYTYPGSTWTNVVAVEKANPGVPIVAIINPNSGPGASMDSNYVAGILSLQSAGVVVLGYVPTGYASRSLSEVESMVNDYKNWYPVNGIFFDEMSNVAGHEGFYSTLNAYAKSLGFAYTVGNPGSDTLASYIGTVDTIVIYENQGLPSLSSLEGWHSQYAKGNFAMMAYGVPSVDQSYPSTVSPHVGYIYITNAGLPNPYGALPPYLAAVASALATSTATTTTTTTASSTATTTATTTASSTATTTTTTTASSTATTTASSTTTTTTTTATTTASSTTTTASSTNTIAATTTTTASTTATNFLVNVTSILLNGNPITGSWTVVQTDGSTVAQGFAPLAFHASTGASYTVSVANYGHYVFNHWSDGSRNPTMTVTGTGATALSAYYTSFRRR